MRSANSDACKPVDRTEAAVAAQPDDERKVQFLARQAAMRAAADSKRREERQARIAARKADKESNDMTATETSIQKQWSKQEAAINARSLIDLGYRPLLLLPHDMPGDFFASTKGKAPATFTDDGWRLAKDWQNATKPFNVGATFRRMTGSTKRSPNLGVLCGLPMFDADNALRGYLTAIDVDSDDESLIDALHDLFGHDNPIRRGRRGGTFLCVTDTDVSVDFVRDLESKVQILAKGRQTAVLGIHPKTLRPWHWDCSALSSLPGDVVIPPAANLPIVARASLEEVIAERGYRRGALSREKAVEDQRAFDKRWRELQAELKSAEPLDYADVDEELDIEGLLESDKALSVRLLAAHDDIPDHNGNDQAIGNMLRRSLGSRFNAHHLKAVLAHHEACADAEKQDDRYVARIMANAEQEYPPSEGDSFGCVADDEEDESGESKPDETKDESTKAESAKSKRINAEKEKVSAGFVFARDYDNYQAPDDLIENLIPAVGATILVGNANTGKTFALLEMVRCLETGDKFLGRNVDSCGALLITGEGHGGLGKRLAAMRRRWPGIDIAVHRDLPDFGANVEASLRALENILKEYKSVNGRAVKFLALDNLLLMSGKLDSNKAENASAILSPIQAFAQKHEISIVIAAHENRSGKESGSYAWRALCDNMLMLKQERNVRTITHNKERDGGKENELHFKLGVIVLGKNKWDNPVTSCVVEPHVGPAMPAVQDDATDGDQEVPMQDAPADRIEATLRVFTTKVERISEQGGDPVSEVKLKAGAVKAALNLDRARWGLPPISEPAAVSRILAQLVERNDLVREGRSTRAMTYRLA